MKVSRFVVVFAVILSLSACSNIKKADGTDPYQGVEAKELFVRGEKAIAAHDYSGAIKYLESLDNQYPFGEYSEQAVLDLVYAYHRNDDNASSAATAKRFAHLYPRSSHVDYAYYMEGVANFDQDHGVLARYLPIDISQRDLGSMSEAYNDFSAFIARFPDSVYVGDARQRMIYLRNLLAQKELNAAEFYLRRKAYVAASNRANYIVQHYAQAPQTERALEIMVKANRSLGLEKQADDAQRVLALNYPGNRLS